MIAVSFRGKKKRNIRFLAWNNMVYRELEVVGCYKPEMLQGNGSEAMDDH